MAEKSFANGSTVCNEHSAVVNKDPPIEKAAPIFTFGVLADVQYGDLDERKSFHGATRYYRNAFPALQEALDTWNGINNNSTSSTTMVSFILQLGDIIDGFNKANSVIALDKVLAEFARFTGGP